MADAERTGVVIAGGFSTRFGEDDKAMATVREDPMFVRVLDRLGTVVDAIVLNCRADQRPSFERAIDGAATSTPIRFALDSEPDRGPLAGVLAALDGVETEYTAVVACDMPWVDPAFLEILFDHAAGHDAAVPALDDGQLQPTQAVYRTTAMRAVARNQLAADRRSLHGALDRLDVDVVPVSDVEGSSARESLRDVNTPAELPSEDGV